MKKGKTEAEEYPALAEYYRRLAKQGDHMAGAMLGLMGDEDGAVLALANTKPIFKQIFKVKKKKK